MYTPITEITDLKSKKFFIEKIELFLKITKAFSEKHHLQLDLNTCIDDFIIHKLLKLNIISKPEHIILLKKTLKKDVFNDFVSALHFQRNNLKKLGNTLDKLDPLKRKQAQKKADKSSDPRIIDFFCGAGGLSLGFRQEGFHIDLANDYEAVCIETFKYNHPEVPENRVIHGDIREIVNHIENYIDKEIDVVVGGPPCQGFSSANQQRVIDDPRNELYKYFIIGITKIAPKFVVMENVRGMLPYADQVVEDYHNISLKKNGKTLSYDVAYKVMVSDNFGVAQKRQRLIFIAVRNDISKSNNITPQQIINEIDKSSENVKRHVLKDALAHIKPLEAPRVKNMTDIDDEITGKKVDVNQFQGNENSYLKLINEGRKIEYVFNHKARYTNDINYEIYETLEQGEDGTSEKIKHVMPYKHRNHIFKDKYFKLIEDKPSRTITAHLKMDCHSHIHPRQVRSITPREAARIQSFSDDYVFLGAYLKTYMQIGNAVPPVMARGIAKVLKNYIK
ncbi:DNA cytosine methyltransferase [Vicingus serpentipes]|uniref:Cytosine-specific methyltransferase n=1 Tax=Vicingus serpentipes TaxID=1926625 RepID=A0A5C6RUX9_9FLAO|nr:DNA cytosine methyltransferase [Vicingus serpentipes]TXB66168.1 DNA cytosine methyltransferase [Vicingus serpentipes]